MKNRLPVGIENFEDLRKEKFYYVDKSGLIRDILQNYGKVNLITRPRRFGKSLNMSMLRHFFEVGTDVSLFEDLEISRETDLCENYMGKFPVISLSLKDACALNYKTARDMLCALVNAEVRRILKRMEGYLPDTLEQDVLKRLTSFSMEESDIVMSLYWVSEILHRHYNRKVIILIDEYDVPLDKAYDSGFYQEMLSLIRGMFSRAFKTNEHLQLAVLTGCLRISKESIFTGLNNFMVRTITDVSSDEYFGFTDEEVKTMLAYYGLESHYDEIQKWYDGYLFGEKHVYCPWDVINYCSKLRVNPRVRPESFWANSSGNSIVRRLVDKATKQTKNEIERLIAGESVRREIRQELTYSELEDSIDNLWSVLFTTGYLTLREPYDGRQCELVIPNQEVREIFVTQIREWFRDAVYQDRPGLREFCAAFRDAKPEAVERLFGAYLMRTISIRDTFVRKEQKENFYHGVLLGLLGSEEEWLVTSNAESGEGYSDILVEIEEEGIGLVIEIKYAEKAAFEDACREAMNQIRERQYAQKLREEGMETIWAYGIACFKKRCKVVCEKIS